jgi:hypothetical protein
MLMDLLLVCLMVIEMGFQLVYAMEEKLDL